MSTDFTAIPTSAGVAAELAKENDATKPQRIKTGRTPDADLLAFRLQGINGEQLQVMDLEEYALAPYRKTGYVNVIDHDSFGLYINAHKIADATTVWADFDRSRMIAVLDDHPQGSLIDDANWGAHRVTFTLKQTPDWAHWVARDGRLMSQADFAEHLEDGADAIVSPAAADMLEIAQSFQAKNNVNFRSANRLDSGEVQLTYEETIQAKAGQRGALEIPTSFELGLAPYEGVEPYRVLARFRYRLQEGRLSLGYKLIRPDQVQRSAFDDACKAVADLTELSVIKGTPR